MSDQVLSTIVEAEQTQKQLVDATGGSTTADRQKLVKLRSKFQRDLLTILQALRSDSNLRADAAKYTEFERRLREVQNRLSKHQSDWMLKDIEENGQGYRTATNALRASQDDFFRWARDTVKGLA